VLDRCGPRVADNPRLQVDRPRGGAAGGDPTAAGVPGVRQAYPVIDLSEPLAHLARDERLVGLFRSLFGGDTPVLFEDKLNYKHPGVGSPFPMHQDYSYWQGYSARLTSALIYLDDSTLENGCLEVVPGRHRQGLFERTEVDVGAAIDHYVPGEVLDPALSVPVPGPPGTVVLFSCFTPHRSGPNLSESPRRALILTYNPAADGDGYEATSGAARERARAWLRAA
jgi:ectoine hydroxylase-related dioxygenase (phytanoyl-CoA dioxygenase family)